MQRAFPKNFLGALTLSLVFCLLSACSTIINIPSQQDEITPWIQSLRGKSTEEQVRIAEQVWADPTKSKTLRNRATYILATRPGMQTGIALNSLYTQYQKSSPQQKKEMEQTLYADLLSTSDAALKKVTADIAKMPEQTYPYSLIFLSAARRNLLKDNSGTLARLSAPGIFMDAAITGQGTSVSGGTQELSAASSGCMALLLPQSGPFANTANQIEIGAEAARKDLAGRGINWDIRIIDTEKPSWVGEVKSLPATCVTLGGVLTGETYNTLTLNKLESSRAVFAFLPRLPKAEEEGTSAWRFFSSREDQVNAMLDVSTELGISSYGVFAPENSYGRLMSTLFSEMAHRRGFQVKSGYYPPSEFKQWTKICASFMETGQTEKGKIPQTRAPFDAIFLPDSWNNMDMIISTLRYQGGHTKVMLGTSLWEDKLSSPQGLNPSTFALTLYPVSLDTENQIPATQSYLTAMSLLEGKASDWTVLGYDFVKMSAALGLSSMPSASELNSRLARLSVDYAGAPFSWNQGKASRKLFIAQPARNGHVPYSKANFEKYRDDRKGDLPNEDFSKLAEEKAKESERNALDELDILVNQIQQN